MITIHIKLQDQTYQLYPIDGSVSWDESGDNQVNITTPRSYVADYLYRQNYVADVVAVDNGREIWKGKLDSIQKKSNGEYTITAYGTLKQLDKIDDYTEFFSKTGIDDWYDLTTNNSNYRVISGELTFRNMPISTGFKVSKDSQSITYGLQKGESIPNLSGFNSVYEIPPTCSKQINTLFCGTYNSTPANFFELIYTIPELYTIYSNMSSAVNTPKNICGGLPDTKVFSFTGRNQTGGTYTVTADSDSLYMSLFHARVQSGFYNTISGKLGSALSPGIAKSFTVSGIVLTGDKIYFTGSGEVATIIAVNGSTAYADIVYGHASNETYFVPKTYATPVIDDLAGLVGARTIYLDTPTADIPNATYIQENAKSVFDAVTQESNVNAVCVADNLYVYSTTVPTYYADVDEYTLEKIYSDTISRGSVAYTTSFGVNRVTGPITNSLENGSVRSVAVKSNATISGAALNDLQTYINTNSRVGIKSDFKVSKLYNSAGGTVDYPFPNARVIIRNLLPELYGISDYTYYLSAITIDIVTGERNYVIGEYIDSVSSLLAGV